MFIKKDKKSLFSISISNSFFNKSFFSFILKFFGIIQIIVLVFFVYMAVALDKGEIKTLIHSVAQQTYWFGKMLTNLPVKWSNKISSNHPILNLEIAPRDYQLLMTLKEDAIKVGQRLPKHSKKIPAVINYKNDKFDVKIRLKGDNPDEHLDNLKWSMRIEVNAGRFLGMHTFNLQHPMRRSYMGSFILHKFTENENLTTKKYYLIPVSINGKYIGVYNYEEVPDHNMNERLTGVKNVVLFIDDNEVWSDKYHSHLLTGPTSNKHGTFLHLVVDNYYNNVIKAHSFREVLNDRVLKKDFERASKLLNGYRTGHLSASEVFDINKVAVWLAMTDLFGANHGDKDFNLKIVYDRDLDRIYPIIWDAFTGNVFGSVTFHRYNLFKFEHIYRATPREGYQLFAWQFIVQLLEDQNVLEKYLAKLDEITAPGYIDEVMKIIKPQVDEYMNILHLDYPEFKVEDEIKRLKENAEYLRGVFLYSEFPFYAYLSEDNKQDNLILVNKKPVPIKIIELVDISTGQYFKVKGADSDFILKHIIPGIPTTPAKVFFECPMEDCFNGRKIENLRVKAKVVGTSKSTSIKINNWSAYAQ